MAFLNDNYLKLRAGYLFPEIGRRVTAFCSANPDAAKRMIRCGIGDVTEPLPESVRQAMHKAVDEMGVRDSFRGYGPEQGYEFLRSAIAQNDYRAHGIEVADDEIFVSDGSKCDCGNILDILGDRNVIAVMDPVYPVYVDTNVMAGHTGPANEAGAYEGLNYLPCNEGNDFVADVPSERADIVYLCFPNNPTGSVATRAQLTAWVEYALKTTRSCSTTQPTRLTSMTRKSPTPFTRSRGRGIARSNSAVFPRTAGSPEPGARLPSCPNA